MGIISCYRWSHTACDLLCRASFTEHGFETHPLWDANSCFVVLAKDWPFLRSRASAGGARHLHCLHFVVVLSTRVQGPVYTARGTGPRGIQPRVHRAVYTDRCTQPGVHSPVYTARDTQTGYTARGTRLGVHGLGYTDRGTRPGVHRPGYTDLYTFLNDPRIGVSTVPTPHNFPNQGQRSPSSHTLSLGSYPCSPASAHLPTCGRALGKGMSCYVVCLVGIVVFQSAESLAAQCRKLTWRTVPATVSPCPGSCPFPIIVCAS